ncbi:MAG: hypothetical protein AAGF32_05875 [Pseudomonadota bacterium]
MQSNAQMPFAQALMQAAQGNPHTKEPPTVFMDRVELMPVAKWSTVLDNPRQRDTVRRAARAKHLKQFDPVHMMVHLAELPDGTQIKLDGHTRAHLWSTGEVAGPSDVHATVWRVKTIDDAKELYGKFDSQSAVENTLDKMFGAHRELGISFQSGLLRNMRFTNALRLALEALTTQATARSWEVNQLIRYWLPELELLDKCNPHVRRFPAPVMAAALLTFARYGVEADEFWAAYSAEQGIKIDGQRDSVQALEEWVLRGSIPRSRNYSDVAPVISVILCCFDKHRRGEMYAVKGQMRGYGDASYDAWMKAARTAKTRSAARARAQ